MHSTKHNERLKFPHGWLRMSWTHRTLVFVFLICSTSGVAIGATTTNAPVTAAPKPTAQPQDYRLMLQRVRIKQQEKTSLDDLQKAIQTFQMRFGRLPEELKDLVTRGVLNELPTPPPGAGFFYDRLVGNVRLAASPGTRHSATNAPGAANLLTTDK